MAAVFVVTLCWWLAPVPEIGLQSAAAAKVKKHSTKNAAKQRRLATRPPVRVDPYARKQSAAEGRIRRGSSTPPPPYSGNLVLPRQPVWDFGPGTILPRTDQLRPRQPGPPVRHVRPRGWDPVPGPGHGPGTYITPIYPGTIGPTGN